jgi:hypothetical protein
LAALWECVATFFFRGYGRLLRLIEKYAMGTHINPEMIPAFQNGNPKNTIAQYRANINTTKSPFSFERVACGGFPLI